ncbi:MAG: DUF3089 domain-containing protein [Lewinellaceae bacterium]|nr:DUF3089 domain-containing protein [Lewinellaceae bacterium]
MFFFYPTTLTGNQRGENVWNADTRNVKLNEKTDSSTILFQASIFNGNARVFAPRYRQAHLRSFFTEDKATAAEALDTAYVDILNAFDYYLQHWNEDRPFIIAGHSQGGRHGMYLLRDKIEGTPLERQLVAAYLVGWPVKEDFFNTLKPCETPEQTDCYCSWRTFERNFGLQNAREDDVVCTNPLNWSTAAGIYTPKTENEGAILRKFCQKFPELADAEVYRGILLCTKPKFPGSVFFTRKNYHIGDLNLYYFNVRNNVMLRSDHFIK